MYLKSRRSTSSLNTASHSQSIISLEGNGTSKNQGKRKYEYCEIQKRFLIPLYNMIKQFDTGNKRQEAQFDTSIKRQEALKTMTFYLKSGIKQLKQYSKQCDNLINELMDTIQQSQQIKSKEVISARQSLEEQLRFMESENNKTILELQAQYGRKEQEYKEVISKFIDSMHSAQKNWTHSYSELLKKFKKMEEIVRGKKIVDAQNKQVYAKIVQFTDELYDENDDQSLQSIDLSDDNFGCQEPRSLNKPNCINFSPIFESAHLRQNQSLEFEECLIRMIYWNFFSNSNETSIKKLIDIINMMENPEQITQEPIFPIILESFKSNLTIQQTNQSSLLNSPSSKPKILQDLTNELQHTNNLK